MAGKNHHNDYVLEGKETKDRLKSDGIKAWSTRGGGWGSSGRNRIDDYTRSSGTFFSKDVTINGGVTTEGEFDDGRTYWKKKAGKIKNSFCPDCGAQGYYTDHPDIATCGAYPGWFYYYKDHEDEHKIEEKPEYIIKIVNGQYVRVRKPKLQVTNERK